MIKKMFFIIFLLFLIEFFSFVGTKLNLFLVNHEPNYLYNQGNSWRNESSLWGAWHKINEKDKHITKCYSVEYRSNNVGARDDINYDDSLPLNSIVLLGDSLAEGMGVNFEDNFSTRLNELTRRQVLNFGSAGHFGPLQSMILYENLAKDFPHNELIFFFSPLNDFIDNNWEYWNSKLRRFRNRPYFIEDPITKEFKIFYPNQKKSNKFFAELFFFKVQILLNNFTYTANLLKTFNSVYAKFNKSNKYYNNSSNFDVHSYFIKDQHSVDGTIFSLSELFNLSQDLNKKTLIIIPTLEDLIRINKGEYYKDFEWYKKILQITDIYNLNLIDLADHFNIQDYKSFINSCDGHWNQKGHNEVSKLVYRLLYSK